MSKKIVNKINREGKIMKKHKIEIAVDHHEGSKFVTWLNKNGHDAARGKHHE